MQQEHEIEYDNAGLWDNDAFHNDVKEHAASQVNEKTEGDNANDYSYIIFTMLLCIYVYLLGKMVKMYI